MLSPSGESQGIDRLKVINHVREAEIAEYERYSLPSLVWFHDGDHENEGGRKAKLQPKFL